MGQIFDRMSRIARAYWTDATSRPTDWAERMLGEDDDDLRRIIEELQAEPPSPSIPDDVARSLRILELESGADAVVVKAAYRRLITQWHPDRHVSAPTEEQDRVRLRTQEINAAYLIVTAYYGHR